MKYRVLFLVFVGGILLSTPLNAQWQCVWSGGVNNSTVTAMNFDGSRLFYGAPGKFVYRSTDNGTTWDSASVLSDPNSYIIYSFKAIVNAGGSIFAATDGGIFRSTDNGASWQAVDSGLTTLDVRALAVSGTEIFAGTWGGGLFHSTDNGTSWSKLGTGFAKPYLASLFVDGKKMYAGTSNGGVYVSTNGGTSWGAIYNFPYFTYTMNAFGKAGSTLYAGASDGLFRFTNNSWTEVTHTSGFKDSYGMEPGVYAFAAKDSAMFVGTSGGIFLSTDNGTTWSSVTPDVPLYSLSLAVSGPYLYAGTYYSDQVWRRPISEMVTAVADRPLTVPERFNLEQNYPNPFNPSTTISYSLSRNGFAALKVFSLLGQEVATLVNTVQAPGVHSVRWNADALSAGVYYYQLRSSDGVMTKKLILMK